MRGVGVVAIVLGVAACTLFAAGSPSPRSARAAGDCTASGVLDAEERAFLSLINEHRAQNGRAPLAVSYTLSKAAQWKSQDMGANAYFAHDDQSRTWVQRIRDCGYGYNTWLGENIAAGISSAESAFNLWRNSPGHNANMLSSNFTAIGTGRAYTAGSPYGWYWTTEFGGYDDGYVTATRNIPPPDDGTAEAPAVRVDAQQRGNSMVINVHASDADGIDRIEFFADGAIFARDTSAPYQARLRGRTGAIVVIAYDRAGLQTAVPVPRTRH